MNVSFQTFPWSSFQPEEKNLIEVPCVCLARPSSFAEFFKKRGEFLCIHLA